MTRRPAVVGLAALLAAGAAACGEPSISPANTQAAAPAPTLSAAAPSTAYRLPACTATYRGGDGSGILLADGTVTGNFVLVCTPTPGPNEPVIIAYGLEVIPSGSQSARWLATTTSSTYQDTYSTAAAACVPGRWRLSLVLNNPTAAFGPWIQITACPRTLS